MHALVRAGPGQKVIGVKEWLSSRDIATKIAQSLGKGIEFVNQDPSFDMGDPDAAKEMADMMGFVLNNGYHGGRVDKSILQPAELGVEVQLKSVEDWCAKQNWSILE